MKRFVEGEDRRQGVLLPEFLDDYLAEDNPVRAIDVFVDELDLRGLGFEGVVAETTGRPAYHPDSTALPGRSASALEHRLCRTASADSSPTRVGSGRTAVRAKAAIPYRVRNRLYGPEQKFRCTCRPPHSKHMRPYIKPRYAT
jgi:hypothetical protein